MGGKITVTSQPGVGSRFSFELCLEEAQAPVSAPRFDALPDAGARRFVLVVDDNAVNLLVAKGLVEKAGFHARGVVNGREALEEVQRASYSLVLMDCHMPEMDGFEATERIRALPGPVSRVPIVALTASAMPDELAACRRVGMNSVLAKPLTFAALREVLSQEAK
jgi:CheY-like chemotaxis protein